MTFINIFLNFYSFHYLCFSLSCIQEHRYYCQCLTYNLFNLPKHVNNSIGFLGNNKYHEHNTWQDVITYQSVYTYARSHVTASRWARLGTLHQPCVCWQLNHAAIGDKLLYEPPPRCPHIDPVLSAGEGLINESLLVEWQT